MMMVQISQMVAKLAHFPHRVRQRLQIITSNFPINGQLKEQRCSNRRVLSLYKPSVRDNPARISY